jgi:hypothetical protein
MTMEQAKAAAHAGTGEYSGSRTELIADPRDNAAVHVRVLE